MLLTIFLKIIECGHLQWSKADIQKSTKQRIGMSDNSQGQELVATPRKEPFKLTVFGGHTDRAPTDGFRGKLYERGLNIGPTDEEVIALEKQSCEECREVLRGTSGPLHLGFFSGKGGPGKSTMATLTIQMLHDINPQRDNVILIDVNTSQTTLHALNGLARKDFLQGKYWTMETLYEFIAKFKDIRDIRFDQINTKLAYRVRPQLPVIPLVVKASKIEEHKIKFTDSQYMKVLEVLERFYTIIVHDFGIETQVPLTEVALSQQHMLGMLTHSGKATTEMVATNLEILHLSMVGVLHNTVVVFNQKYQPSHEAQRAIALEKAGKSNRSKYQRLISGLSRQSQSGKELQTPGQAVEVINDIIDEAKLIGPLSLSDISLVGWDSHLAVEDCLFLSDISPAVQAQLWSLLHRMLRARVQFEAHFLALLESDESISRDQMVAELSPKGKTIYTIVGPRQKEDTSEPVLHATPDS
jgi:MinD-like ATPase involved in chromosome partitioning or flagellar assembly